MTPEDEEFEAIAKFQAKKQAEKSLGDGDCDSPSWCKHYGKCHRKTVGAPMLANCIDTAETQEPVAFKHVCNLWIDPVTTEYIVDHCDHPSSECIPAYIGIPPITQRQWVGLTDEDKQIAFDDTQEASGGFWEFADAIEAKLKEKNGGAA